MPPECAYTGEAVRDSVAVWVIGLQDVNDSVWQSVLADLDVFDGRLDKHGVFVVDVRHRHTHVGRSAQRRDAVVSRRHREVVRVVRQTVVIQSPTQHQLAVQNTSQHVFTVNINVTMNVIGLCHTE